MGFFSSFFKAVFAPVNTIVAATSQIVYATTNGVDTVVKSVATALAPIPVVGTVLAEASQQVDNATDLVDHAMNVGEQVVADAGTLTGGVLGLNGDDFSFALNDILANQVGGTVDYALTDTVSTVVTSVFDFG